MTTKRRNRQLWLDALHESGQTELEYIQKIVQLSIELKQPSLIETVLKNLRPLTRPVMPTYEWEYNILDAPSTQAKQILAATASGRIPPDVCQSLLTSIHKTVEIEQVSEVISRLEILESKYASGE